MPTLRIALAQINVTVGDLAGNTDKILDHVERARGLGADLVAFPELAITGYPPEDLLFKPQFIRDNLAQLDRVIDGSSGIGVVVGFATEGPEIYNAAAFAYDGRLAGVYHKIFLPNYGVFDEQRYFKAGAECPVYVFGDTAVGVNVCEDIWYENGPAVVQRAAGAQLIVNINGSPYHAGKLKSRDQMLSRQASGNGFFLAYVNMVGGQDELVFDGGSMILDPSGEVVARGPQFEEAMVVADVSLDEVAAPPTQSKRSGRPVGKPRIVAVPPHAIAAEIARPPIDQIQPLVYDGVGEVYAALVMGTRDYVRKSGFSKVLVALSGGIDSSLVVAIAVDALGAENVVAVAMPSRFSSEGSILDASELADNLGIELKTIPIEEAFSTYMETLAPHFEGTEWGVAEENIQSRIRGNLIMALSNKFGWMVMATGNKSEMATGYATIYGDMAGGFAVIKDVPKTLVYQLAEHRNRQGPTAAIPDSVIRKAPSAELRPDQRDEDSLPAYSTLDPILKAYVEEDRSFDEIVGLGFDRDTVERVIGLVDRSEYKRRQAPPGIKITPRNFGRDRRMPIASRYRPY